jgi:hypothetical protein
MGEFKEESAQEIVHFDMIVLCHIQAFTIGIEGYNA